MDTPASAKASRNRASCWVDITGVDDLESSDSDSDSGPTDPKLLRFVKADGDDGYESEFDKVEGDWSFIQKMDSFTFATSSHVNIPIRVKM